MNSCSVGLVLVMLVEVVEVVTAAAAVLYQ